jgi:hypothetical protein
VIAAEFNPIFGPRAAITVPYDAAFTRFGAHWSGLYYGASLAAMTELAEEKGYALVGTNRNGMNAFYVRSDLLGVLSRVDADEVWVESKVRDSRDASGALSFVSGMAQQLMLIADMPVVDIRTGTETAVGLAVSGA